MALAYMYCCNLVTWLYFLAIIRSVKYMLTCQVSVSTLYIIYVYTIVVSVLKLMRHSVTALYIYWYGRYKVITN